MSSMENEIIELSSDEDEEVIMITSEVTQQSPKPMGELSVSFLKMGQAALGPRTFVPHECDPCCSQASSITFLRGYNPYSFPTFAGWSRRIFETSLASNGKSVVYVAPCGRSLRTIEEVHRFLLTTSSSLGIEWFTFEPEIELFRPITYVQHQCILYDPDISRGQEKQPISMINFLDKDRIDPKFTYCSTRFSENGSKFFDHSLDPGFLSCCSCEDNCANPLACSCQQLTTEGFDVIPGLADVSRVRGYKYKRLEGNVPFGIYECNARCSCNVHCPSRVVQQGIQVMLQIFKTSRKGWGVRALHDIPSGALITVYSAKLLHEDLANDFGNKVGDAYFANLDFIDCAEATKEGYESECAFPLDEEDSEDEEDDLPARDREVVRSEDDEDFQSIDDDEDDDIITLSPVNRNQSNHFRVSHTQISPGLRRRSGLQVAVKRTGMPLLSLRKDLSKDTVPNHLRAQPESLPHESLDLDDDRSDLGSEARPQIALKRTNIVRQDLDVRPEENGVATNGMTTTESGTQRQSLRSLYDGMGGTFVLDAMEKGNVGRFFNHSCSPNSFAQNVFFETHDLRFPTIAFFASRNIFALEEITWDYQYEVDSIPGRKLLCQCRSADCRGRLL